MLRRTGEAIGYVGLVSGDQGPELAFELLSAHHGQGLATEAANAMVDYAQAIGMDELWASVWDWNVASRRVLEKLGFREVSAIPDVALQATNIMTWRRLGANGTALVIDAWR